MFRRLLRKPADDRDPQVDARARARQIDELMAGPVRDRPAITVVGDDDVFGVYPLPTKS